MGQVIQRTGGPNYLGPKQGIGSAVLERQYSTNMKSATDGVYEHNVGPNVDSDPTNFWTSNVALAAGPSVAAMVGRP